MTAVASVCKLTAFKKRPCRIGHMKSFILTDFLLGCFNSSLWLFCEDPGPTVSDKHPQPQGALSDPELQVTLTWEDADGVQRRQHGGVVPAGDRQTDEQSDDSVVALTSSFHSVIHRVGSPAQNRPEVSKHVWDEPSHHQSSTSLHPTSPRQSIREARLLTAILQTAWSAG